MTRAGENCFFLINNALAAYSDTIVQALTHKKESRDVGSHLPTAACAKVVLRSHLLRPLRYKSGACAFQARPLTLRAWTHIAPPRCPRDTAWVGLVKRKDLIRNDIGRSRNGRHTTPHASEATRCYSRSSKAFSRHVPPALQRAHTRRQLRNLLRHRLSR